jgi:hypothetical protein
VLQPVGVEVQTSGAVLPVQPGLQVTLAARHAPNRQVTSHAHAVPQLTAPPHDPLATQSTLHAPGPQPTELHDELPLQVTLHAPRPHVMVLQVWRAPHAIVHDVALPQLTPLLHWLATEHVTLQLQPAGQVIAWLQAPWLAAQSIAQVFRARSHDVHCDGHTAASASGAGVSTTPESAATTQNPSTHVRPFAQRCSESQAKSLVRWLTEQPAASATARVSAGASARAVTSPSDRFTAVLRA